MLCDGSRVSAYVRAFKVLFCFSRSRYLRDCFRSLLEESRCHFLQDLDTQSHKYGSKWLSGDKQVDGFPSTARPRIC